jgi:hypothetical protein
MGKRSERCNLFYIICERSKRYSLFDIMGHQDGTCASRKFSGAR